MDRSSNGLRSAGPANLPPDFDLGAQDVLDRATAIAALAQADDLLERSEPEQALPLYVRGTGCPDRDVAAAAYYGLGNVLYRLDRDAEARVAWQRATSFGDSTPAAYRAWRQVAAAFVREGDLRGALDAYRHCERLLRLALLHEAVRLAEHRDGRGAIQRRCGGRVEARRQARGPL